MACPARRHSSISPDRGRRGGTVRQGHAHGFDSRGHGIGRIHAATGPGARAGVADNLLALRVSDFIGNVSRNIETRPNIERFARGTPSWPNRAAIDHQGGQFTPPWP